MNQALPFDSRLSNHFRQLLLLLWVGLALTPVLSSAQVGPRLQEVQEILKQHLPQLTPAEMDAAAAKGLIRELQPRVLILTNSSARAQGQDLLNGRLKTNWYSTSILYLQVGELSQGTAQWIEDQFAAVEREKKRVTGLVLDFRFTSGNDYQSAVKLAGLFLPTPRPLFDLGEGMIHSQPRSGAPQAPLVFLVNEQTSGAAEALVASVRAGMAGLLVGRRMSGVVALGKEVQLSQGERLLISGKSVLLANQPQPYQGLSADVEVKSSLENELAWIKDPTQKFGDAALTNASNHSILDSRLLRRTTEAELVRRHREGLDPNRPEAPGLPGEAPPEIPQIQDPALLRALDLVRGLSVLQPRQGP